jgi:cytochrome c-type biogenesis protein CcmH/NrfG
LEAAIRLNPADGESYVALGRLQLAQGDAKSAVVNLEAAARLEPGNAALQQELAEAKSKAAQN